MQVHATLRDYTIFPYGEERVIYGTIYGDTKGRFVDGTDVRTSLVQTIKELDDGTVIAITRNTTYKLENPIKG